MQSSRTVVAALWFLVVAFSLVVSSCSSESGECEHKTCEEMNHECGIWADGCGNDLACGDCTDGEICNTITGRCVEDCTPDTCAGLHLECGTWDNGCGAFLECGDCTGGETCNTTTGQCVGECTPSTCVGLGRECGIWDDGCGTDLDCGGCSNGETCNTTTGQCVGECTPNTCVGMGYECDTWDDGCGTLLNCGDCGADETCIQGLCVVRPVLSLDSQDGDTFTLRWTYLWSGLGSTNDHYKLEESTSGSSSGFSVIIQTVAGDHSSPWTEILTRVNGMYYYRVQAISSNGVSGYSNVVTVNVGQFPATLRIVNDLYDEVAGENDWAQMNQLFSVRMAGDFAALESCNDSCDRLSPGSCAMPGQLIPPDQDGGSWA
ncbi:MAG: hypothetical protein JRF33_11710, partial [Deltaproteobacteria bacterium]|nr:hypothetical protein [Deltaproteobacteria bacterium]